MAEEKDQSTSVPVTHPDNGSEDPEDPAKSAPSSSNSSIREVCCFVFKSWVSKKFTTGCVVLFPVAVTFFFAWWLIQIVDGFFNPIYERLGIVVFGLGYVISLVFLFFAGVLVSSWIIPPTPYRTTQENIL